MRIRYAATALVALGAVTAGGLTAALLSPGSSRDGAPDGSSLLSSSWSVESAPDYGYAWSAPRQPGSDTLAVRVDTASLRARPYYQPLTLRTTRGSTAPGEVTFGRGTLAEGDPATAAGIRVRAVVSADGVCAAAAFERAPASLLAGDRGTTRPIDATPSGAPVRLPAATASTAGPSVSVCVELSTDPAVPAPDGTVTLGWPVDIQRAD